MGGMQRHSLCGGGINKEFLNPSHEILPKNTFTLWNKGSGWLQVMYTPPLTLVVGHQTEIARDAELVTSNKAPGPKRLISATQFL